MQDRYERIIEYMRVSVTDRCNLRCVYCMPLEGVEPDQREALLETLEKIAQRAVERNEEEMTDESD